MQPQDYPADWPTCECGCGQPVPAAEKTYGRKGVRMGDPLRYVQGHNRRKSLVEYVVDEQTGCWVWQRTINPQTGYGSAYRNGRMGSAHRAYYEEHVGPIPEGLHIDHLCSNRPCVNPAHLEAVTCGENLRRAYERPNERRGA